MTAALLRREEVMRRLGVGRTKFAQMVADGEIPKPRIVSGTVRAWHEDEITEFINSRPVDLSYPNTKEANDA